jgi:hypothetical protein
VGDLVLRLARRDLCQPHTDHSIQQIEINLGWA